MKRSWKQHYNQFAHGVYNSYLTCVCTAGAENSGGFYAAFGIQKTVCDYTYRADNRNSDKGREELQEADIITAECVFIYAEKRIAEYNIAFLFIVRRPCVTNS